MRHTTDEFVWLVVDLPLWKMMEWKSEGIMTFPIWWEVIMFQTTNQMCAYIYDMICRSILISLYKRDADKQGHYMIGFLIMNRSGIGFSMV